MAEPHALWMSMDACRVHSRFEWLLITEGKCLTRYKYLCSSPCLKTHCFGGVGNDINSIDQSYERN